MLTPEAVVKLWNEIIDDQRKNKTGVFAWKNSDVFLKIDCSDTLKRRMNSCHIVEDWLEQK